MIGHDAACLLDDQHAGREIPIAFRRERHGRIGPACGDEREPIGDRIDPAQFDARPRLLPDALLEQAAACDEQSAFERLPAVTWIGASLRKAPCSRMAWKNSPVAGLNTAPSTGLPSCTSAADMVHSGTWRRKALVPSIGSTIHTKRRSSLVGRPRIPPTASRNPACRRAARSSEDRRRQNLPRSPRFRRASSSPRGPGGNSCARACRRPRPRS